jgi:hypothetical protein
LRRAADAPPPAEAAEISRLMIRSDYRRVRQGAVLAVPNLWHVR